MWVIAAGAFSQHKTNPAFVESPDVGSEINQGDETGVVESVKAASDIYSPVSGEVVERNEAIEADPSLLNTDPFGTGWIFKIRLANPADLESLQDAVAYRAQIGG